MTIFTKPYWILTTKIHYYFHDTIVHEFMIETWDLFKQLWIFLVAGILLSSVFSVFWNAERVAQFFDKMGKEFRSSLILIVVASLIGVVSPMPVYVVIPLIVVLFRVGVPAPVLFAFLVSSPLMNPVLFTMTLGALGSEMALARTISAVVLGCVAGYTLYSLNLAGRLNAVFSTGISGVEKRKYTYGRSFSSFVLVLSYEFYRLMRFSLKYFFLGILTAALVKVVLPAQLIIKTLGEKSSVSVLVAVAAGVPLYACGGGTIPVMKVLMALGMNKGAILAFFISGPATKISTLVTLNAALKKSAFAVYLAIAFGGALFFGFLYDWL